MDLTLVRLAGADDLPLLVVGPSLGTSAAALWGRAATLLGDRFHVVGWELPGHGSGRPTTEPFSLGDLATAVVAAVDATVGPVSFAYAGDSVGGAVGLELALDHPGRVSAIMVLCSGAKIGTAESWQERAATVRSAGTPVMVESSAKRWFAPGFLEREPEAGTALLAVLQNADAESYALACEALAAFDVRDRRGSIQIPLLAVGGSYDVATPADALRADAAAVPGGRYVELDGVAHLAPIEAPRTVATLLADHLAVCGPMGAAEADARPTGTTGTDRSAEATSRYDAGMVVRREVLGDEHVDRATAGITDVTRDFQELITQYAWGSIWTRPGLARRDRSIAVLTALIAGRHFEELEFHLRAALRNGLSRDEIVEVLLQSAIYVGVPAANTAFAVAKRILAEG